MSAAHGGDMAARLGIVPCTAFALRPFQLAVRAVAGLRCVMGLLWRALHRRILISSAPVAFGLFRRPRAALGGFDARNIGRFCSPLGCSLVRRLRGRAGLSAAVSGLGFAPVGWLPLFPREFPFQRFLCAALPSAPGRCLLRAVAPFCSGAVPSSCGTDGRKLFVLSYALIFSAVFLRTGAGDGPELLRPLRLVRLRILRLTSYCLEA